MRVFSICKLCKSLTFHFFHVAAAFVVAVFLSLLFSLYSTACVLVVAVVVVDVIAAVTLASASMAAATATTATTTTATTKAATRALIGGVASNTLAKLWANDAAASAAASYCCFPQNTPHNHHNFSFHIFRRTFFLPFFRYQQISHTHNNSRFRFRFTRVAATGNTAHLL